MKKVKDELLESLLRDRKSWNRLVWFHYKKAHIALRMRQKVDREIEEAEKTA